MITHVSVKNYKSLANVDVDLGPLTVLVGQNGTGKSNFVDVLRFVSDAAIKGLDQAIMDRKGMRAIRRYSPKGRPFNISITLKFYLDGSEGELSFELAGKGVGDYTVSFERCLLAGQGYEIQRGEYHPIGQTVGAIPPMPPYPDSTTLFLSTFRVLGKEHPVRKIWEFLLFASHYSIFPNTLRVLRTRVYDSSLTEDGGNIASVLRRLKRESSQSFSDIVTGLSSAVAGIVDIDVLPVSGFLVVRLKYKYDGHTSVIDLSQESDGTLRLLGILAALYQDMPRTLITLEEPELTIHPGALLTLYEVIKEASQRSQIVITTHSPDLLHYVGQDDINQLRAVEKVDGMTYISPLDERQIGIINDQLAKASDLLRIQGLHGHPTDGE